MAPLEFICDSSELMGIWGAEIPDVLITGGYALKREKLPQLLENVRKIKKQHGLDPECPVKWNLRDLDRALASHDLSHLRGDLLKNSDALRKDLVDALVDSEAITFLSIILAYSNNKQVLGTTREELVGYSFGNLLMRAGLYCQEAKPTSVDFILDWPERNDRGPFTKEYYAGWRNGKSAGAGHSVAYRCGPLSQYGFAPSPLFAGLEFEPRLQLADLVVGIGREFVEFALGNKLGGFGVQRFKSLRPSLFKTPAGAVMGRGISVSPTNSDFSNSIVSALKQLA